MIFFIEYLCSSQKLLHHPNIDWRVVSVRADLLCLPVLPWRSSNTLDYTVLTFAFFCATVPLVGGGNKSLDLFHELMKFFLSREIRGISS